MRTVVAEAHENGGICLDDGGGVGLFRASATYCNCKQVTRPVASSRAEPLALLERA
jgi:hypothetical protein